jgi:hypothetical protein
VLALGAVMTCTHPTASHAATPTFKTASQPKTATTKPRTATTKEVARWRVIAVPTNDLKEVSGCTFSRRQANTIWVHNDADDGPYIAPLNIVSAVVGPRVKLEGVTEVDPEDIATTATGDIVLADIGDNAEQRTSVQLYRFPEPLPNARSTAVRRYDLTYPDGAHNAEALFVDPNSSAAFVVTKDPTGVAQVFQANLATTATQTMVLVGTVRATGEKGSRANLFSAADSAADSAGTTIVLRTYQYGYQFRVPRGDSLASFATMKPRRFTVPPMAQAEGLCISPDGRTLVTASESQGAETFALAVGKVPS